MAFSQRGAKLYVRMMNVQARFAALLEEFPCGPGSHCPSGGIRIEHLVESMTTTVCETCGKGLGPFWCLFCDQGPQRYDPPREPGAVRSPDGRDVTGGLCSWCRMAIAEGHGQGWSIVRSPLPA